MSGGLGRIDHALGDEDVEALVEGWTVDEVLAIHDFLQRVCERLWVRHELVLVERLLGLDDAGARGAPAARSANLELELDEPDQPF